MRINGLHDALNYYPNLDGFWDSDNLPATEARILGKMPGEPSVELLTQLAHVQALQGRLSEAQTNLDQARQQLTAAPPGPRAELRWNLEQGRVFGLSMSPSKAHELFTQAWKMADELQEPFFAVDAALMISTVRPPKFQNEWLKKALDIVEQTDDATAKLWLSHLLFLDGWHAFDFRQFAGALESFDRALALPLIRESEVKGFALNWSKARTLRALERTAEALTIQESLLTKMTQIGNVSGHVYLEIAECKQLLQLREEAKSYFELAYATLSANSWYSDNKSDELERMKYLYKKR